MNQPKPPAPIDLDPSFLTPIDAAPPAAPAPAAEAAPAAPAAPATPAATSAAAPVVSYPLVPLPPGAIPAAFAKAVDPAGPAPGRMMAARAMAPIPPKALVPIIYQLHLDPDPKIAAAAAKSFANLDDKLLAPVLGDALPSPVLEALAHVLVGRFAVAEKLLLNRGVPDSAFVWVAEHAEDANVINVVVENQERLLRDHNIVRALKRNARALRSDLDKAVDFLVREGVFLDDVPEFEDAFLRLGKSDQLTLLKNIRIGDEHLTERERAKAAEMGMSAEDFITSGADLLSDEERDALLDELVDDEDGGGREETDFSKTPFMKLPIPIQIKMAMTGPHEKAIEALNSPNRVVAGSAIRNPKIKENDVVKISRSKTMHEDVIRFICNNGDWTKSYTVKFNLVQNPKTPPSLVSRWLPLLRTSDLKNLAKSKQVPSNVSMLAKRMLNTREA
jgi:hypothetical protein